MNHQLFVVLMCLLVSGSFSGCVGWVDPFDRDPEAEWLEAWIKDDSEKTRAIVVGGHARELEEGQYEVRGYFVAFSQDFPASAVGALDFTAYSGENADGDTGHVPPVDLAPGESYTFVSPPLLIQMNLTQFTIAPDYDPIFPFHTYCPIKDESTECDTRSIWGITSDVTEHLLYDRLGAWEMPTIDIVDLACRHAFPSYEVTCSFGTWNWYELAPANATLTARLRARDDGLFHVVQTWDIPFGEPLAHNDTREYAIELGNATQWVVDHMTNDFYIEIVAQRPDNSVSMSHLMTHILVNPLEDATR